MLVSCRKNAIISLRALQTIQFQVRAPQVLVVSPTIKIAEKIEKLPLALGEYLEVQVNVCIQDK